MDRNISRRSAAAAATSSGDGIGGERDDVVISVATGVNNGRVGDAVTTTNDNGDRVVSSSSHHHHLGACATNGNGLGVGGEHASHEPRHRHPHQHHHHHHHHQQQQRRRQRGRRKEVGSRSGAGRVGGRGVPHSAWRRISHRLFLASNNVSSDASAVVTILGVALALSLAFTLILYLFLADPNGGGGAGGRASPSPYGWKKRRSGVGGGAGARNTHRLRPTVARVTSRDELIPIVLVTVASSASGFFPVVNTLPRMDDSSEGFSRDYGGILYESIVDIDVDRDSGHNRGRGHGHGGGNVDDAEALFDAGRRIRHDYRGGGGKVYTEGDYQDDDYRSAYYAFDDDVARAEYSATDGNCRRTSWHLMYHPNCNAFHELYLDPTTYLSHGFYRDVWATRNEVADPMVMKTIRHNLKFKYDYYEFTRMDALVMERLTSSPRIVDMYGHCALSVMTEKFAQELESYIIPGSGHLHTHKLQDSEDVDPQNEYTPEQKLRMALDMASAIAELHGFKDGVIVHDDVQLCQFLLTEDGRMKLNDFNRAEVMLWDEERGEYCKYRNGRVYGNYRAPEEDRDDFLNEKIDVYSIGNNIYGLLTGLWIYYGTEDDQVVQQHVKDGNLPYVDERYRTHSYEEGKLVEIMLRCWESDVNKRASIFEVVDFLRAAVEAKYGDTGNGNPKGEIAGVVKQEGVGLTTG